MLVDEIRKLARLPQYSRKVAQRFLSRAEQGNLTRDENTESHFCVYFLLYHPQARQVFVVHHKKSGLWLSPGGHIDAYELLFQTLKRKIWEELGFEYNPPPDILPFQLTITPISNPAHACRMHYEVWYRVSAEGRVISINPQEFHEARWLGINEARALVTDPANLEAVGKLQEMLAKALPVESQSQK